MQTKIILIARLFIATVTVVIFLSFLRWQFPDWALITQASLALVAGQVVFMATFIPHLKASRDFTGYLLLFEPDVSQVQVDAVYDIVSMPPPGYKVYRNHRMSEVEGQRAMVLEIFNSESPRAPTS